MTILQFLKENKHVMDGKLLYMGLIDLIKLAINKGVLKNNAMLPTEQTLEIELGISRITVRKALKILEEEQVISRFQGRGTFVMPQHFLHLDGLPSFTDNTLQQELEPGERRLAHIHGEIPEKVCLELGCPPKTMGHFLKRVRLINKQVIALEEKWLPFSACPEDQIIGVSLYTSLREINHMPTKFNRCFFAEACPPETAHVLGIDPGLPILVLIQTGFLDNGFPIEYGRIVCHRIFL